MKPEKAFTLIELLIVVAIIGILAAIAVPNFLQAQLRAKVAKAVSNMRAIENALEMYRLDNNSYPRWAWDSSNPATHYMGYRDLTTPISYISSSGAFENPFRGRHQDSPVYGGNDEVDPFFELATWQSKGGNEYDQTNFPKNVYLLESSGPDAGDNYNANNWPQEGLVYQPSNGLHSRGDIYRGGGVNLPSWVKTLTY